MNSGLALPVSQHPSGAGTDRGEDYTPAHVTVDAPCGNLVPLASRGSRHLIYVTYVQQDTAAPGGPAASPLQGQPAAPRTGGALGTPPPQGPLTDLVLAQRQPGEGFRESRAEFTSKDIVIRAGTSAED